MRKEKKKDYYWGMDVNEAPKLSSRINGTSVKHIKEGFVKYLEGYGEDFRVSLTGYFALLVYMEQTTVDGKIDLNEYTTFGSLVRNRLALNAMAYEEESRGIPLAKKPTEDLITWYHLIMKHIDAYVMDRYMEYLVDETEKIGNRPIDRLLVESEAHNPVVIEEVGKRIVGVLTVKYFHRISDSLYGVYEGKHPKEVYDLGKFTAETALEQLLSNEASKQEDLLSIENEQYGTDDVHIEEEEARSIASDMRIARAVHKDLMKEFLGSVSQRVKKKLYANKGVINEEFYNKYFKKFLQEQEYSISQDSIRLMALLPNQFDKKVELAISEFSYE